MRIQADSTAIEESQKIGDALAKEAGIESEDVGTNTVGPSWGSEITSQAIKSLVIFLVLIAIYISWQLEWRMAVAALIAVLHDVIITVGIYSIFGFEVTPATVISFLTILGYSLYDTIVVFDRVKENQAKFSGSRTPYSDIVNISMNQVLMRSLNTSIASILPVMSLLVIGWGLLGAAALEEFALALFIGMVSGVYSSIFVATPLLASMRRDTDTRVRRQRLTGEALRSAVLGSSASGRNASHVYVGLDDPADGGGELATATSGAATTPRSQPGATPDQLLSHPPRPRKKKRH